MNGPRDRDRPADARAALTRRTLLRGGLAGAGSLALHALLGRDAHAAVPRTVDPARAAGAAVPHAAHAAAARAPAPLLPGGLHYAPRAKSVIWLHMAGGPSQLDLFTPKPTLARLDGTAAPAELLAGRRFAFLKPDARLLGSPYAFARHGEAGHAFSELLPHTAAVADKLTFVHSMHTSQFNHAPAQVFMSTGHERIGRPSMGAWTSYGLGSASDDLPAFVVLVSGGYDPSGGTSCWGSGFLPTRHQGVRLRSQGDPVLFLSDPPGMSRATRRRALDAITALDERHLERTADPEVATRIAQYELAWRMQSSVPDLLALEDEPETVRALYGVDLGVGSFARNCLLARRLVERGVRFVQLYHWGWDSHGTSPRDDIVESLPARCLETDRASAALVTDLRQRGLLDETLVVWGGEFGRTAMNEARDGSTHLGRDHHRDAFSMWLAGGGIAPGVSLGETDDLGWRVTRDPVDVHDLHATLLHLLGFDHERLTYRFQGRDFRLTDVSGRVVDALLA